MCTQELGLCTASVYILKYLFVEFKYCIDTLCINSSVSMYLSLSHGKFFTICPQCLAFLATPMLFIHCKRSSQSQHQHTKCLVPSPMLVHQSLMMHNQSICAYVIYILLFCFIGIFIVVKLLRVPDHARQKCCVC